MNKMIHCSKCNTIYNNNRPRCPTCNAKNMETSHIPIIILLLVIFSILIYYMANYTNFFDNFFEFVKRYVLGDFT